MAQTHNTILSTGTSNTSAGRSNISAGYSGTSITTITDGSSLTLSGNTSYSISNSISNNMNRQVKVAVFSIERNDKGTITSSKFVKELWIEQRNGASIELAVAKQLDKDFDPANIIIREIYSVNL